MSKYIALEGFFKLDDDFNGSPRDAIIDFLNYIISKKENDERYDLQWVERDSKYTDLDNSKINTINENNCRTFYGYAVIKKEEDNDKTYQLEYESKE